MTAGNLAMKIISALCLSTILLGFAAADTDWSNHQFRAPQTGDLRGPCPGLNTLANHGFIPRDGRNLSVSTVIQGSLDGFNIPSAFIRFIAKLSILTSNGNDDHFTLEDIALHGTAEHDASVSRSDYALGSNLGFNATLYNETLAQSNPGVDYYNTTSAGFVQKARLDDSLARNPNVTNTIKEAIIRNGESALYLCVMGGCANGLGRAPKKFVDIFFREERLPLAEGWTRPEGDDILELLKRMRGEIGSVSEWKPTPGQYPWVVLGPGAPEDPLKAGALL